MLQKWWDRDRQTVLGIAGNAILNPALTIVVGVNLRPWLLELLVHAEEAAKNTQQKDDDKCLHHALTVALSKLVTFSKDAVR